MSFDDLARSADPLTRRTFIARASQTFLGLGSLPMLDTAYAAVETGAIPLLPATAKRVIYLYMSGGMSHLDTFDPKPGSENQGPTEVIKTNTDGVLVSQYFTNMAHHMDKVAVINSMNTTQGAHAQGRYYMHTNYEMRGTIKHPSVGAWVTRMQGRSNPTLPGHVIVGGGAYTASAGFFGAECAPLPLGDPETGLQHSTPRVSEDVFARRLERLHDMDQAFMDRFSHKDVDDYQAMFDQAVKLMSSRDLQAFDLSKEPDDLRAAYGQGRFAQGCLLARRLIEHDVRFVEVVSGGWDTHNQNFEAMEDKVPYLDRALGSLLADLDSRGLLEETLVVLATEFGRTPRIVKERNGRNHYPKTFTCLLAGGGIQGGRRYGKTSAGGEEVIEDKVTVPDFNATIAYACGLPTDHVLFSPTGRPFTVGHKGKPVKALFA